ncbi:MAG: hypothetical protein IKV47_03865 [Oscillospiraceae bacterium]|nr:hypothetical protein [Oscillospiraceae bacterium]
MNAQFRPSQNAGSEPLLTSAIKYLTILFWLALASLIVTLITWLPIQDRWAVWVKRAFDVGTILCLFLLTPANLRYRKSAFFRTAIFCCTILNLLIGSLLLSSPLLRLSDVLVFILSIGAGWHLYRAHAELIADHSAKMARNWRNLFWWELVLSMISTTISVASYILAPDTALSFNAIAAVFTALSSLVVVILNAILAVISIIFLGLTVNILKQQSQNPPC